MNYLCPLRDRIRIAGIVTILLLGLSCASAPKSVYSDPTGSIPLGLADRSARSDLVTIVPFERVLGDKIFVHATVDGWSGGYFLDTGAPVLVLNCLVVHTAGEPKNCRPSGSGNPDAPTEYVQVGYHVHTVRIGTLSAAIDSMPDSVVRRLIRHNAMLSNHPAFEHERQITGRPCLGALGLNVLAPFETIIDYPHKKLILIRLDSAGNRLASVPGYTLRQTIPLIESNRTGHFDVEIDVGSTHFLSILDTGGGELLSTDNIERLGSHLIKQRDGVYTLNQLSVSGQPINALTFSDGGGVNLVGPAFLHSLSGVVGLNFRARQLTLYN